VYHILLLLIEVRFGLFFLGHGVGDM